ncbi:MAG TPA: hypothetical protein VL096_09770, partial [Pirellulaceae bacterium]|nr:hypothetical protein [Pirellulaceae bacterium]
QPLVGDRTAALQVLCAMGQRALTAAAKAQAGAASPEEQRLLEQLPRAMLLGNVDGGALYSMPGELLTVVAVQRDVADRVAFCGLGLEASENSWSLYGIRYSPADASQVGLVELPPGANRVLSLASGAQASTLVFTGESAQAWVGFYRSQATRHNWQVVHEWKLVESSWQATYRTRESPVQQLELQFRPHDAGRWVGLVTTQAMASSE